jgi:hypothetical protein
METSAPSTPATPLLGDIQDNYEESMQFLLARKQRQVQQLILLNNLNRGDQNITSTLLLTLLNRVLSSLYDDKMQVKFLPSQGIMQEQLNAYNTLAQSDYQEMNKAKIDYDWVFDTLFFGRGYVETYQFDKKRKIMVPHVINPLSFGYDPYFENPQEWRYYWKWITKSKYQLQKLIKAGKITGVKDVNEITAGQDPQLWEYKTRRDAAQKGVQPPIEPAKGNVYQILEYFGYDENGDKCAFWIDKDFTKVLMKEKLELDDAEGEDGNPASNWPIVVKESFRTPHSSIPFSVADLLEDKHRAKSVLLNLMFIAAKDKANPIYLYNPDQVTDVTQFLSRQVNQHIPVNDIENAVAPLNTQEPMSPEMVSFMTALQAEANDPVGTGVNMQPEPGGKGTATEAAIDQQLSDMAQSLQSKVLQFGESEFWSQWFHRYAKHAEELQSKMANIVGVNGITSTEIDLGDFVTDYPPGVMVYSAKEAEYKNLVKRRDLMQLYPQLQQSMEPNGFKNFNKHVFWPLVLEDPSLIDIMFPKSLDEIKAEEENELIKQDHLPPVLPTDDHTTHIYIHNMVQPKTWALWYHLAEHEQKLAEQQAQQQQAAQAQMQEQGASAQGPAGHLQVGAERSSPMGAAAPLKSEAKTSMNSKSNNT